MPNVKSRFLSEQYAKSDSGVKSSDGTNRWGPLLQRYGVYKTQSEARRKGYTPRRKQLKDGSMHIAPFQPPFRLPASIFPFYAKRTLLPITPLQLRSGIWVVVVSCRKELLRLRIVP